MSYETDEQVAELTKKLENGVMELYASDQYAQYISAMTKFNHYSCRNALLILFQCPHASKVAGYGTWKQLGRYVKAKQHGIKILAPCKFRDVQLQEKIDPTTGRTLYGPDGSPLTEKIYLSPERFTVKTVFDLSQTEGKELPEIRACELSGDVADYPNIYKRLAALSPLPVVQEEIQREDANGYASFTENRIVIKPGMSQVQTIKTLVHEIAHAKLHEPEDILIEKSAQQTRHEEVEAESVAYVVCQYFGIDTSDYSLGYIAGWSKGREVAELKASLDTIHSTAKEIIHAITPVTPMEKLLQNLPEQKKYRPKKARR